MSLYIKASCDAMSDAKFLEVGPEGFCLYMKGLMYAKVHLTDGAVPGSALALIGIGIKNPKTTAETLVTANLWERTETGYSVGTERWARHQTTKEEVETSREAARIRKAAQRDRSRGVTQVSQRDMPVTPPCDIGVTVTPVTAPSETETETETIRTPLPPRGKRDRFVKPTDVEIAAYGKEIGLVGSECRKFRDHYESNGWMVGKAHMRDWRASMRGWLSRIDHPPGGNGRTNGHHKMSTDEIGDEAIAKLVRLGSA